LGIELERIRPAHPEENGRHERMHRTLKFETARPARGNLLQQQERFDEFREEFNFARPHDALGMKRPADGYERSPRAFPNALRVNRGGQIYLAGIGQVALSVALAGEEVGIREERDGRWLVSFTSLDLGHVRPDKSFSPITASNPPEAETV